MRRYTESKTMIEPRENSWDNEKLAGVRIYSGTQSTLSLSLSHDSERPLMLPSCERTRWTESQLGTPWVLLLCTLMADSAGDFYPNQLRTCVDLYQTFGLYFISMVSSCSGCWRTSVSTWPQSLSSERGHIEEKKIIHYSGFDILTLIPWILFNWSRFLVVWCSNKNVILIRALEYANNFLRTRFLFLRRV